MRHEFYNYSNWYSRFLPHYDSNGKYQMITYRLNDSVPKDVVGLINNDRRKLEIKLDSCLGSCLLGKPEYAEVVIENWKHFHNVRYDLIAYVVMPNHVHLLIKTKNDWDLSKIVYSWKSFTAKSILSKERKINPDFNMESLWAREYCDRFIRDGNHYLNAIQYILNNPVKARLAQSQDQWPFSGYNTDYYFFEE